MGRFSGVCRAVPSLRTQPDELLVASCGLTQTATLSMLCPPRDELQRRHAERAAAVGEPAWSSAAKLSAFGRPLAGRQRPLGWT